VDDIEEMRKDLKRVIFLAVHLHQMIPQDVWREQGVEYMGQYEGDHHATETRDELIALQKKYGVE
jgi:hypothetical protein